MTETTKIVPKKGDHLVLDGIDRVIIDITDRGKAIFDNPPDAPAFGKQVKKEDGTVTRERLNPSRAGTCSAAELVPFIKMGDVQVWTLPGRMEAHQPKPDAVKLAPANYNINSKTRAAKK